MRYTVIFLPTSLPNSRVSLSVAHRYSPNSNLACMADRIVHSLLPNLSLPILNLWTTFLMMCSRQYLMDMLRPSEQHSRIVAAAKRFPRSDIQGNNSTLEPACSIMSTMNSICWSLDSTEIQAWNPSSRHEKFTLVAWFCNLQN
jgi:hypothetical protein